MRIAIAASLAALAASPTLAQETPGAAVAAQAAPSSGSSASDLAQKLSNPVASLISVPFQYNLDFGLGGEGDGAKMLLNVQPVVPLSVGRDWNLIVRTILPLSWQAGVTSPGGSEAGLGDIVQSFFLSPKTPGASGIVWGVGPVILYPTATEDALGGEKWGAGPTAVVLKQSGPLTYGVLANHIWSFAGSDARSDISATFMQPFLSYTTPEATTYALNLETTYDWNNDLWIVPVNLSVSQLTSVGKQPISVGVGGRYYLESPTGGPEWGIRAVISLLFPTG